MDTEPFSLLDADSVSRTINVIRDTLTKIAENTTPQKVMIDTDVDVGNFFIAFISLVVSIISAWFGFLAYHFSKKTADNVVRMTADNQIAQFDDLTRHLYRNLVCTLAMKQILEQTKNHTSYPSEEHFLKLRMLPEDVIHLEKYNNDKAVYMKMHELKLLLRNYDTEIDVYLEHFKNPEIEHAMLIKDIDSLSFKPFYLISHILDIKKIITSRQRQHHRNCNQINNALLVIISEHFNKLAENLKNYASSLSENYIFNDYCKVLNNDESPENSCVRAYQYVYKIISQDKDNDIIHLNDVISDKNHYLDSKNRSILMTKDFQEMYCNTFKDRTCCNYAEFYSIKENSYTRIASTLLSVDVCIEKNKIRIINFKQNNE